MSAKNTASVQRYRARLSAEGYGRMEVMLGRSFVKQLRVLARQKQMPFWLFVEGALVAYASSGNPAEPVNDITV